MPGRDNSSSNRGSGRGQGRPSGSGRPRSGGGPDRPRSGASGRGRSSSSDTSRGRSSESARPRRADSAESRSWEPRSTDRRTSGPRSSESRSSDSRQTGSRNGSDSRNTSSRRDDRPGSSRAGSRPGDDRPRRRSDDSRPTRGPRRDDRTDSRRDSGRGDKAPVGRRDTRGGERNLVSEGKSTVQTENLISLPNDIDIKILPKQVIAELRNISPAAADFVSKHLAAALYALEAGDAALAHQHAIAARSRAARLPAVREMCGMAAYEAELWAEALNEFRTYMRLTGDPLFLPLMADCERGLGRPQRALQLARSEQVRSLDAEARMEMRIVASGARRDLGQFDAAVAVLEVPELNSRGSSAIFTRLRYAYAEALLAAGDRLKARDWFVKTALSDVEDITDASERALELND